MPKINPEPITSACAPRVLIADDDALIRDLLTDLLIAEGFEVDAAVNGADAVRAVRDNPPDLVLMDLMMPVISGAQATAMLKDDPRTAAVPIVAMSAGQSLTDGTTPVVADDFIPKPFDLDRLMCTVNYWVEQSRDLPG